eukprot:scaffold800_cov111-Isochrysis_galbana.AAC.8
MRPTTDGGAACCCWAHRGHRVAARRHRRRGGRRRRGAGRDRQGGGGEWGRGSRGSRARGRQTRRRAVGGVRCSNRYRGSPPAECRRGRGGAAAACGRRWCGRGSGRRWLERWPPVATASPARFARRVPGEGGRRLSVACREKSEFSARGLALPPIARPACVEVQGGVKGWHLCKRRTDAPPLPPRAHLSASQAGDPPTHAWRGSARASRRLPCRAAPQ